MTQPNAVEQSYILDLHKENTIMLNKALFWCPVVHIFIFITQLSKYDSKIATFFMLLSICCAILSILFFLYSFVVSERAIDSLEEESGDDSVKLNYQVKMLNNLTMCLIFSASLFGIMSLFLKYM